MQRGSSLVGDRFILEVGPVAHGGHFVARHEGRVIFVRHALPGEQVEVLVSEGSDGDRFLRAEAVRVIEPSVQRVRPPCPYAGPGLCGGCDFQHIQLDHQRELKAAVISEQLSRLAGLVMPVVVEPVPGDQAGLRWRTRVRWARTADGRRGFHRHRSRAVLPVDDCLITRTDAVSVIDGDEVPATPVTESVHGRAYEVAVDGFWQVHVGAPPLLVSAVLDGLAPRPGDTAVDLYAGAGLFSAFLAEAVGESGRVVAVEGETDAAAYATLNLRGFACAQVMHGRVDRAVPAIGTADIVVLDPPREGAKRAVVEAIGSLAPRAVAYVACDPSALARDVAIFAECGYVVASLRAFDAFPMTQHVECVAILTSAGSRATAHP